MAPINNLLPAPTYPVAHAEATNWLPHALGTMLRAHHRSWGVTRQQIDTLRAGPDHPMYWEAYTSVLAAAALPYSEEVPHDVDPRDAATWRWRLVELIADCTVWATCTELKDYLSDD